jgi:hypothetical protein
MIQAIVELFLNGKHNGFDPMRWQMAAQSRNAKASDCRVGRERIAYEQDSSDRIQAAFPLKITQIAFFYLRYERNIFNAFANT